MLTDNNRIATELVHAAYDSTKYNVSLVYFESGGAVKRKIMT